MQLSNTTGWNHSPSSHDPSQTEVSYRARWEFSRCVNTAWAAPSTHPIPSNSSYGSPLIRKWRTPSCTKDHEPSLRACLCSFTLDWNQIQMCSSSDTFAGHAIRKISIEITYVWRGSSWTNDLVFILTLVSLLWISSSIVCSLFSRSEILNHTVQSLAKWCWDVCWLTSAAHLVLIWPSLCTNLPECSGAISQQETFEADGGILKAQHRPSVFGWKEGCVWMCV